MKKAIVIIFLFVVMVGTVWLLRFSSAPDLLDVNMAQLKTSQWHLPDGVIARIGKGTVNDLVYSPDSTMLAVASSTGTWLYDTHSGNEVALLTMMEKAQILLHSVLTEKNLPLDVEIIWFDYGMLKPDH